MHIFVDESGTFTGVRGQHSISVVGALIVPDTQLTTVERRYGVLRAGLPQEKGEVKGRLLSERDVASIVSLLARYQVVFEITAIDMGIHEERDIAEHKAAQEEALTKNLTAEHHPNVRAGVLALRARLERMTHQLYVQSVVTFDVIHAVLNEATLYYSQRIPKELGIFHWVIDAKDRGRVTDWEDWWSYVVRPLLQSKSLRQPMAVFTEGDYSHFERFGTETPEHLRPHYIPSGRDAGASDLNKIMTESFRFSSAAEPGLEMADIVVNATRRALTGNLGIQGWRDVRRLMIHRRHHYIRIVAALKSLPRVRTWPYMPVLRHFSHGGKNMLAPRFLRRVRDRDVNRRQSRRR